MTCNDIDNSHPLLVATSQECRSRLAADGAIGVEIGKGQSLRGHAINLGSLDPSIKKAGVSISQIIGQNHYDIGPVETCCNAINNHRSHLTWPICFILVFLLLTDMSRKG